MTGDSRSIDIIEKLNLVDSNFAKDVVTKKINGIFSSPPYVGVIDYHEQHAYAYDLFELERKESLEIGPLYKGQGKAAQQSYVEGIVKVLLNSKKYLIDNYDVFLERLLKLADIPFSIYGFDDSKADVILFKPHGSISFSFNSINDLY